MSKRTAPEERIDFENHEDVILSDDGRATPSLGYYMKQPMVWATTLAFFSYNYILFLPDTVPKLSEPFVTSRY